MGDFPLCLNTSTIRPTPLVEKIRLAGRAGFEAIEPWNDEVDAYLRDGGTLDDLRSRLADAGLEVVSMIALFGWTEADPTAYAKALEDCRRKMEQAARLGSPFIVASPPQEVVDPDFAAARYADLLRIGREIGVRPSVEFLGFVDGVKTLAAAKAIVDRSGDARATLVADVYHLLRGGGAIDDLLACEGDRMAIFHINDLPAEPPVTQQRDEDRVMLGEGIADLPRVIADLRAIGYRGPISLELFNETLWAADPAEVCRAGIERMKALIASS